MNTIAKIIFSTVTLLSLNSGILKAMGPDDESTSEGRFIKSQHIDVEPRVSVEDVIAGRNLLCDFYDAREEGDLSLAQDCLTRACVYQDPFAIETQLDYLITGGLLLKEPDLKAARHFLAFLSKRGNVKALKLMLEEHLNGTSGIYGVPTDFTRVMTIERLLVKAKGPSLIKNLVKYGRFLRYDRPYQGEMDRYQSHYDMRVTLQGTLKEASQEQIDLVNSAVQFIDELSERSWERVDEQIDAVNAYCKERRVVRFLTLTRQYVIDERDAAELVSLIPKIEKLPIVVKGWVNLREDPEFENLRLAIEQRMKTLGQDSEEVAKIYSHLYEGKYHSGKSNMVAALHFSEIMLNDTIDYKAEIKQMYDLAMQNGK